MRYRNWLYQPIVCLIRLYQIACSPILNRLGVRCRFYPTCSEYTILAVKRYGLRLGLRKSYARLMRCRPDNLDTCIDYP